MQKRNKGENCGKIFLCIAGPIGTPAPHFRQAKHLETYLRGLHLISCTS